MLPDFLLGLTQDFAFEEMINKLTIKYLSQPQEFTFEEITRIQEQIKNKNFEGKLICGNCKKDLDPYEDFDFCGLPIFSDQEDFSFEQETFNPVCRECNDKIWGENYV